MKQCAIILLAFLQVWSSEWICSSWLGIGHSFFYDFEGRKIDTECQWIKLWDQDRHSERSNNCLTNIYCIWPRAGSGLRQPHCKGKVSLAGETETRRQAYWLRRWSRRVPLQPGSKRGGESCMGGHSKWGGAVWQKRWCMLWVRSGEERGLQVREPGNFVSCAVRLYMIVGVCPSSSIWLSWVGSQRVSQWTTLTLLEAASHSVNRQVGEALNSDRSLWGCGPPGGQSWRQERLQGVKVKPSLGQVERSPGGSRILRTTTIQMWRMRERVGGREFPSARWVTCWVLLPLEMWLVRWTLFFAAKDGEVLYSQQKQDPELTDCGSDHELLIA